MQFDMIYVYGEKNGGGGNGEIIMKMGVANRSGGLPFHVNMSIARTKGLCVWFGLHGCRK